jgi:ubiquinone/menaquinone biosynthesis C-methylase UbiE
MGVTETIKTETERYYRDYESRKGRERNDILRNPEVLFQVLAAEASVLSALRFIRPNPERSKVLDIGCGDGSSLLPFLRSSFPGENLYGVDIRPELIRSAQKRFPMLQVECADAAKLEFADQEFDIVHECMIFLQITDDDLSERIAREMLRVTKRGGFLVISDWRYGRPGTSEFKAMDGRRISHLFSVGSETVVRAVFPGALVPPLGRFLSKNLASLYFMVRSALPFTAGQMTTVLCKT